MVSHKDTKAHAKARRREEEKIGISFLKGTKDFFCFANVNNWESQLTCEGALQCALGETGASWQVRPQGGSPYSQFSAPWAEQRPCEAKKILCTFV
jgi:hypothetical protein